MLEDNKIRVLTNVDLDPRRGTGIRVVSIARRWGILLLNVTSFKVRINLTKTMRWEVYCTCLIAQ